MNTELTRFDLQIEGTDVSSSASISSTNPEDLMRLLVLSGQGDGNNTYTINISSTQQTNDGPDSTKSQNNTMNVRTKNPTEIERILQLCGLQGNEEESCDDVCAACGQAECQCDDCGSDDENSTDTQKYGSTEVVVAEQQAEYDYGHKSIDDEQSEFDIKDYNFKGLADLPERLVSAKSGSNPLVSTVKEGIHAKLLAAYKDFLGEGEVDNAAGIASPLTANARDKFDKDPSSDEESDTSGVESPLSDIKRQHIPR